MIDHYFFAPLCVISYTRSRVGRERKMAAEKSASVSLTEPKKNLLKKLLKFEFRQMLLPLDCCLINTIHYYYY